MKIDVIHFDNISLAKAPLKEEREKDYPISNRLFWKQNDIFYCEGVEKCVIVKIAGDLIKIVVPHDYYSNGRNVPYFLRKIFKQIGVKAEAASFYHDYLYENGSKISISRESADKMFYKILLLSNVNKLWAYIMYKIVHYAGKKFYRT